MITRDDRSVQTQAREVHDLLCALIDECEAHAARDEFSMLALSDERAASARNLSHYLALRKEDRRDLQKQLLGLGLSSLGRSEPAVMNALSMVRHAAGRLVDPPITGPEPAHEQLQIQTGRALLDERTDELFGMRPQDRTVRIMVTMPSLAAEDPKFIEQCLKSGMDAMRINTAHDDADAWLRMIKHLRKAEKKIGRRCRVFADLGGSKIRTSLIRRKGNDKELIRISIGDEILLHLGTQTDEAVNKKCKSPEIWCDMPVALKNLEASHPVWFDDGKVGALVESIDSGIAKLRVCHAKPGGQKLRLQKGINLPDTPIEVQPLSKRDRKSVQVLANTVDGFCMSFVQRPKDVHELQVEIAKRTDRAVGIVLKIETKRGFENLPQLLTALMHAPHGGVMIARGDLAVEVGFARLAEVQEEILWLCEAAHTPVIWATEVLSSLAKSGVPARAEITDAAMAQRAECVMLNKGPEIHHAIEALGDILTRMESHQRKKMATLRPLRVARDPT